MLENIFKCRNPFWCETCKIYKVVQGNFLAEHQDHWLLQLINGNNQLSQDGRANYMPCMDRVTLATTFNPDISMMSNFQYMRKFEDKTWLRKPQA